jgi:hypothetical protein
MCLRIIDTARRGAIGEFCSEECLREHLGEARRMERRIRTVELSLDRARRRMLHGWAGYDEAALREMEATLAHLRAEHALHGTPVTTRQVEVDVAVAAVA